MKDFMLHIYKRLQFVVYNLVLKITAWYGDTYKEHIASSSVNILNILFIYFLAWIY